MNNKVIGIFGKRGTGKTLLLKTLIPTMQVPVLIVDETGTFKLKGIKYYNRKDDIIYKYTVFTEETRERALNYLQQVRRGTLIIDDGDYLLTLKDVERSIIYSRNYGYSVYYVAKRIVGVSKRVVNNTDDFYFFRVVEQKEIKKIYDSLGVYLLDLLNLKEKHYIKYRTFT